MTTRTKHSSFLETSSKKFFNVGLALSLLLVIGAFKIPLYSKTPHIDIPKSEMEDHVFEITITPLEEIMPELPKEVKPIIEAPVVIPTVDPILVTSPDPVVIDPVVEKPSVAPVTTVPVVPSSPPVVDFAEIMPQFKGGEAALMSYLSKNIRFDSRAIEQGYQGKVYVRFIVDSKGAITNVEIAKGVHPLLDNEAIKVVKNMPSWTPGEQNGKKTNVRLVLPINFIIAD